MNDADEIRRLRAAMRAALHVHCNQNMHLGRFRVSGLDADKECVACILAVALGESGDEATEVDFTAITARYETARQKHKDNPARQRVLSMKHTIEHRVELTGAELWTLIGEHVGADVGTREVCMEDGVTLESDDSATAAVVTWTEQQRED